MKADVSDNTWLLTPAPRSRLLDVKGLHKSVGRAIPPHRRVVVTTLPNPIHMNDLETPTILFASDEFNIGKWWNTGLDWIEERAGGEPYQVVMAESDARFRWQDIPYLAFMLRDNNFSAVGPDWHHAITDGVPFRNQRLQPVNFKHRLCGVASMVAGEIGLRRDENFRWWYSDDDAEWRLRQFKGGTGIIPNTTLKHAGGTPIVGDIAKMCAEDLEKFKAKWNGHQPLC